MINQEDNDDILQGENFEPESRQPKISVRKANKIEDLETAEKEFVRNREKTTKVSVERERDYSPKIHRNDDDFSPRSRNDDNYSSSRGDNYSSSRSRNDDNYSPKVKESSQKRSIGDDEYDDNYSSTKGRNDDTYSSRNGDNYSSSRGRNDDNYSPKVSGLSQKRSMDDDDNYSSTRNRNQSSSIQDTESRYNSRRFDEKVYSSSNIDRQTQRDLEEASYAMSGNQTRIQRGKEIDNTRVDFKTVKVQKPYYVMGVKNSSGHNIFLYDVSSYQFLLYSEENLDIEIDGRKLIMSKEGFVVDDEMIKGYIIYKETPSHIKFLDDNFGGEKWRSKLKRDLPAPKIRNESTEYLWEGKNMKLYEYNDKSVALITEEYLDIFKGRQKLPCKIGDKKFSCYYISKGTAAQALAPILGNFDFESKYKLSAPVIRAPQSYSEPVFIAKRNCIVTRESDGRTREQEVEVSLYEYSKDAFAYTTNPEDSLGISSMNAKKINGLNSFIFPKKDQSKRSLFYEKTGIRTPETTEQEELPNIVSKPKQKDPTIFDMVIPFYNMFRENKDLKQEKLGNKYIVYGNEDHFNDYDYESDILLFTCRRPGYDDMPGFILNMYEST